jgi:amino acid adenylation domain-containing protein
MTTLLQDYGDRQADLRPEATALVFREERLTYGDLALMSNRLARLLTEGGCEPGDRVALLMPKSPMAIVAMLGILKAGCIYVPMDAKSPTPRLARVVDACEPRWVLAAGHVSATLDELLRDDRPGAGISVGWMDGDRKDGANFHSAFGLLDLAAYSGEPVDATRQGRDAAHILFTSGSTGQPKGVVITHANVIGFVDWAVAYFGISASDRMSGHSPLSFDLSTFDIYGSFAGGAELHLVPPELNLLAPKLATFIRTSALTQWFSVPSVLSYMANFDVVAQGDFPELRRLLWCGEVFPTSSLIYWMKRLPHVKFTNLYGPTEATIASSYYTVPTWPESEDQAVPIGEPCPGEELLVLDDSLEPVPPGQVGNLYIAGVGLSPGYWRDPAKTRAVFRELPGEHPRRIYKTGDLAAVGNDGLVYFHGRSDHQIKSRGYRIELGEIETALSQMEGLHESAVVAIPSAGFEGTLICCAYVSAPEAAISPSGIRAALTKVLPSYMLPSRWMGFDRLPRDGRGKVDRKAIEELLGKQA